LNGWFAGNQHESGFTGLQIYASLGGRRARSGEAGSVGAKCHVDGADGLLDRGPAGAFCFAMACGKDREDATGAAPVRDVEGLSHLALWRSWGGRQGIRGLDKDQTTG